MLGDQLCHVEHGDLGFAAEHDLQVCVRVDVSPVLLVLQIMLLDILPKLLYNLSAGYRFVADDFAESVARLQRFHERCIRFFCHFELLKV